MRVLGQFFAISRAISPSRVRRGFFILRLVIVLVGWGLGVRPADGAATFRVTEYYFDTTDNFTGTTYDLTLDQDLADHYFVLVKGSWIGDGWCAPSHGYVRVAEVPGGKGDLPTSGASDVITLSRFQTGKEWAGVVTVVECLGDPATSGFKLVSIAETALTGTSTSGTDTSPSAWSDIDQVVLFGSFRGGGMEFEEIGATNDGNGNDTDGMSGFVRLYPSSTNTLNWARNLDGTSAESVTFTTFVVEWGSEWTVQRVYVTGTQGGNGVNAVGEYTTGTISSVVRSNTWVWATGYTTDGNIGDCAESVIVTLGDGVNRNTSETKVAVGKEYSGDTHAFDVYTMTHTGAAVSHEKKPDNTTMTETVEAATAGSRFAWTYNTCWGGGTDENSGHPREVFWARYTANATITHYRGYGEVPWCGWVQGIDLSGVTYSAAPAAQFRTASSGQDESTNAPSLAVYLSYGTALTATVDYAVSGGTATNGPGLDYTLAAGTLTFLPTVTNATIVPAVNDDALDEADETVLVTLSGPHGCTLGVPSTHTYTIEDNDDPPSVAFLSGASAGSESTAGPTLDVRLAQASGLEATVGYAVSGGTASNGVDYTLAAGVLTFAAGETNQAVELTITGDGLDEPDETIEVALSNANRCTLGAPGTHTYTIQDDDDPPSVQFSTSGSSGPESVTNVTLAVALAAESAKQATVDCAVTGGTATGADYTLAAGTLTFSAGETNRSFSLVVIDDTSNEPDETVQISLSGTNNCTLGAWSTHTYTIEDDDPGWLSGYAYRMRLTVPSNAVTETLTDFPLLVATAGTAATNTLRHVGSGGHVQHSNGWDIVFTKADGTNGLSHELEGYDGAAGALIGWVRVPSLAVDADTTVWLYYGKAGVSGSPEDTTGVWDANYVAVWHLNQDPDATVGAILDSTSNGLHGTAHGALTNAGLTAAWLGYGMEFTGGTGSDYIQTASDQTTNALNRTTNAITLEAWFNPRSKAYSFPVHRRLGTNVADAWMFWFYQTELNFCYEHWQDGSAVGDITVDTWSYVAGTWDGIASLIYPHGVLAGSNAYANTIAGDHNPVTLGAGEEGVLPAADFYDGLLDEVRISAVARTPGWIAACHSNQAAPAGFVWFGTEQEGGVTVAFAAASSAGPESQPNATLWVMLSAVAEADVTVDYAVSGGMASNGVDYTLAAGTLTIAVGATSNSLALTVTDDGTDEPDEEAIVELSNASGATLSAPGVHTYTIQDEDAPPSVAFEAPSSAGAESVAAPGLAVSLSLASGKQVTVDYGVTGGTAGNGVDYTLAAGTLTFVSGTTNASVTLSVADDGTDEPDETVTVALSNTNNCTLGGQDTHEYTIQDNDDPPSVRFDGTASSGSETVTSVVIGVSLSVESALQATVDYAVTGGTASGADYTLSGGTLTFSAGETNQSFSLGIVDDINNEPDETVQIGLSGTNNCSLGAPATHTYTIEDDDPDWLSDYLYRLRVTVPSNAVSATLTDFPLLVATAGTSATNTLRTFGNGGHVQHSNGWDIVFTAYDGTNRLDHETELYAGESGSYVGWVRVPSLSAAAETGLWLYYGKSGVSSSPERGTNVWDAGYMAVWHLADDPDGAAPQIVDSTVHANDGYVSNSTENLALVDSHLARGLDFPDARSYVDVPLSGSSSLQLDGTQCTFEAWAFLGPHSEIDYWEAFFDKGAGYNHHSYLLGVDGWGQEGEAAKEAHVRLNSGPAAAYGTTLRWEINDTFPTNQWVHEVFVYDGTGAWLYVNGTLVNSGPYSEPITKDPYAPNSNDVFWIGTRIGEWSATDAEMSYQGYLDELRISDVPRRQGWVQACYSNQVAPAGFVSFGTEEEGGVTVAFVDVASSGPESQTNVLLWVALSDVAQADVTVDYGITGGTASNGVDYTLAAGTLTITVGATSNGFSFTVTDDALDEPDEELIVALSSADGATLTAPGVHTYTVQDDDAAPSVAFDAPGSAGAESVSSPALPVSLAAVSGKQVTVDYGVTGGSASNGIDYTLSAGTLTFLRGTTNASITISVSDDANDEPNETVTVALSNTNNCTLGGQDTHSYEIQDNDDPPGVQFYAAGSGQPEPTNAPSVAAYLSVASAKQVTVDYDVTGGTASNGVDYTLSPGALTFSAGQTNASIVLSVSDDGTDEPDETVVLTLSNTNNCTLGTPAAHTYTIEDDDPPPAVQFDSPGSSNSESVSGPSLPLSLSLASAKQITVGYAVTGGTASNGVDYTLGAGTLTFVPGQTAKSIDFTVDEDGLDEENETVVVALSVPVNVVLGANSNHTYTIDDNDDPVSVGFAVGTTTNLESVTNATLEVLLSQESAKQVTVDYAVTGGTASNGVDYTLSAGTLSFAAGVTNRSLSLTVTDDVLDESDETIELALSNPGNCGLGTITLHTCTVQDNDAPPSVAFLGATSGASEAVPRPALPVALSLPSGKQVTLDYGVTGGTASNGVDYTLGGSTLTFAAGATNALISLNITNDEVDEGDETVTVGLLGALNATLGAPSNHTFTIQNDDGAEVAFKQTGSSGAESVAAPALDVVLTKTSVNTITVDYAVSGGTASNGLDYVLAPGTLTFAPGETNRVVTLSVTNDANDEADETVLLELSNPSNAALGATNTHSYTILDDDGPPTVQFGEPSSAGSESVTNVALVVGLSVASELESTVAYGVTGGTASNGVDYTLGAGVVTFAPGQTNRTIALSVMDDALDEPDETIVVTLSDTNNCLLGAHDVHTYTIQDEDPEPTVQFDDPSSGGSESAGTPSFGVSLSAESGRQVTVEYAANGGTAENGIDYVLAAGVLTFAPGATADQIGMTVTNDSASEDDETVRITLSGPVNVGLGANAAHTYTILNDDIGPIVRIAEGATWAYRKGTAEASDPRSAWRALDFEDGAWSGGAAPFGYGPAPHEAASCGTVLTDMSNGYSTVFLRKTFTVGSLGGDSRWRARASYDDGFILWVNGERVWDRNEPDGAPLHDSLASVSHEGDTFETNGLGQLEGAVQIGQNVAAVQVFNATRTSSDCKFELELSQYRRVADTTFSHDRGFYDSPFVCTIATETAGATITYTLNGEDPRTASDTVSGAAPVTVLIDPTNGLHRLINGEPAPGVVLRAYAHRAADGYEPTDVDSHTYIFLGRVDDQGNCMTGETWVPGDVDPPASIWAARGGAMYWMDTTMDADVLTDPRYSGQLTNSLTSVPTLSLVLKHDDMFSAATGIQWNGKRYGRDWERPCSLELIHPDGSKGFQIDCGVKISGAWSRTGGKGKNSWSIRFRGEYGATKLRYELFPDTHVEVFDHIRLRAQGNDQWVGHSGTNAAYVEDDLGRQIQRDMGWQAPHGTWAHLYINGMYWGLYNPVEVPCAAFMEEHYGGEKEEYDVLAQRKNDQCIPTPPYGLPRVIDGTNIMFYAMYNWITNQNMSIQSNYDQASTYLDIAQQVDYNLIEMWGHNRDWDANQWDFGRPYGSNWRCGRRRDNRSSVDPQFHFFIWDVEGAFYLGNVAADPTHLGRFGEATVGIGGLHGSLRASSNYRTLYADSIYKHMVQTGGALTPAVTLGHMHEMTNQMALALIAESARWGDAKQSTPSNPIDHFVPQIGRTKQFLENRTANVLPFFRTDGLYPLIDPPDYNQDGGAIASGFLLTMTNPNALGTIYYTTNGVDPRSAGGARNTPPAQQYAGGLPLTRTMHVKARVYKTDATWSAVHAATFNYTAHYPGIRITEIQYNPLGGGDFEFIEIKNTVGSVRGLSEMAFGRGIHYTFAPGAELGPGKFAVLVRNEAAFTNRYPTVKGSADVEIFGEYLGGLDNGGERLELVDCDGVVVTSVRYNDRDPWPTEADGDGYSLVFDGVGDQDDAGKWRASNLIGGSPGYDDGAAYRVVISEALTHTDPPLLDAIELHNAGSADVQIGGWFLSDSDNDYRKFALPSHLLGAGGYVTYDEDDFNTDTNDPSCFALSSHGDEIYLTKWDANTNLQYLAEVRFKGASNGVAFARHVRSDGAADFVAQSVTNTLGAANAYPRVGPVVINELMYHPATNGGPEYIELRNVSDMPAALYDGTNSWKLDAAVDYTFPTGTVLSAGEYVLVVPTNETAFRAAYPAVPGGVRIFGPYTKQLDNAGESVKLWRPGAPDAEGVPWILADRVNYNDNSLWPESADGAGLSLERIAETLYGNDPANWSASTNAGGTPGTVNCGALVSRTAGWLYHDLGADLGATWRATDYDDCGWDDGNAPLGYPDTDPLLDTELDYGGHPAAKHITTYFRKAFMLGVAPSQVGALDMTVRYDDGFVAYLNGTEVARGGMAGGAVSNSTLAVTNNGSGGLYETFDLSAKTNTLVQGLNVLAVEVHQYAADSSDLFVDLDLLYALGTPTLAFQAASSAGSESTTNVLLAVGLSPSSDQTVTVDYAANGGTAGAGVDYTLAAGTLTFDPGVTALNIGLSVTNDWLVESNETVVVGLSGASGAVLGAPSNHTYAINDNDPEPVVSIAKGSTWRWRKGTDEASEPVATWRGVPFDDSGWSLDTAPHGYGEGPYNTALNDMSNGYASVFFRHEFPVMVPGLVKELGLCVKYDDGFILWIDGEEIARVNVPGAPGATNAHDSVAAGTVGAAQVWTATLSGAAMPILLTQTNTLAIQVFNDDLNSPDCTFDAELSITEHRLSVAEDADQDGLPDGWENDRMGATTNGTTGDVDFDGWLNIYEYIAGTHPTNPDSLFNVALSLSGTNILVTLPTEAISGPGYDGLTRHYAIEARDQLGLGNVWLALPNHTNILGQGQDAVYTNTVPQGPRFYRGRVWLE